jgi:endoglucanase
MILIHAYILSKDQKYLDAATGLLDYLLGRNPMDISYLTGYGVNSAKDPHHRPSQADGIDAPIPGMLVGGPNYTANDCAKNMVDNKAVAKSYYDNSCSFATNEVAINWNAPFAYLVGSIQAITATGKAYDVTSKATKTYQLDALPAKKLATRPTNARNRLVVKGNSLRLEMTGADGTKKYYDLRGKKMR